MNPIVISLEGNIGAGKSTLLDSLKKSHPEWTFVDEPVDQWLKPAAGGSLLQHFYENQSRWAYTFQNAALLSRTKALSDRVAIWSTNPKPNSNVFVTERSIEADKNVFAKLLYRHGVMNDIEMDLYTSWFEHISKGLPGAAGYIHLDTPVTVCHERIERRAREGETMTVDYLDNLDSHHFAWLRSHSFTNPVMRYDNYSSLKEQTSLKDVEEFVEQCGGWWIAPSHVPAHGGENQWVPPHLLF